MSVAAPAKVGPIGYWTGCFRKYATFSGRARRAEYWWFTLFNLLTYVAVVLVGALLYYLTESPAALGALIFFYFLAVLLPSIAVVCRRLHDIGLSGWWQLLNIIPGGGIAVLIMMLLPGQPQANKFGPDPRQAG